MRVLIYPCDRTGCGTYRCTYPAHAARKLGVDVHVAPVLQEPGKPTRRLLPIERHPHNPRMVRAKPVHADVVVFQRPVEEVFSRVLIPQLQASGVAVVVEVDDDLHALPAAHPAARALSPALSPGANWRNLMDACRLADLVTCSTPALASRYGAHGRVAVIRNRVPERLLDQPHKPDGETVGWRGWTVTHPEDLQATRGGVADALQTTGWRFLQIGLTVGVKTGLSLDSEPAHVGPTVTIDEFYPLLSHLDIAIAPLRDCAFNRAKSCLAGLEYAACGVPFVASDLPEYRLLADAGIGLLAGSRAKDWRRQIERLARDISLRAEMSISAREIVRRDWTIEAHAHLWADAWAQARANADHRLRTHRLAA